jgi:DEAD/DEAH box helicase domain-containing protein
MNDRLRDFEPAHRAELPARSPCYGNLSRRLPEALGEALLRTGINKLYSHQAEALEQIRNGSHTVVSTPTSSGKSLIYNLAVTEALIEDPRQRALYLFPIKALTRDQLEALTNFFESIPCGTQEQGTFSACIYDGDTTSYQRAKIRQNHPHVLLTNPDMLHYALLAYHSKWEEFWKQLRFVIIDEMHSYRGIFGSHVALVLRRLHRICRHYGSEPQFILLSATIGNPDELASKLTGVPEDRITVVSGNGAPQAKRHFVFLRPKDGLSAGGGHAASAAARLILHAAKAGLKTIAFTQSRKLTELVHMSVLQADRRLERKVSSYRAGFLPEERRVIEQKLASGALSAVISTSALELGIDIGGLDLCILVGYPGTVMTTWQRGGRVGRSGQESAIVLLPDQDALDQYIVNHPTTFLESRYEKAVIDPFNPEILKAHLPCAAAELPISRAEPEFCRGEVGKALEDLTSAGCLLQTLDGDEWICASTRPHRQVDIRTVGASYTIVKEHNGETVPLGKSEGIRALKECHSGAVYLHRGETYQVQKLDLERKLIRVAPAQVPYFTRAVSDKETEILETFASKPAGNFIIRLGRLRVTEHITAFEARRLFSHVILARNPLDLPPQTFETVGFWIEIETILAQKIKQAKLDFMGGIHAIEHALISMFPLFAVCDRNDIGGISIPLHPQLEKAGIFVYDGYPGGIGLAARGYEIILDLIEKTKELIASCGCTEGCPACIHSPKCGSGNKPLDKAAASSLLQYLSGERGLDEGDIVCEDPDLEDIPPVVRSECSCRDVRIGFFDLETQKLATEVGGWQNTHLMRVSVAVLCEMPNGVFKEYRENELSALIEDLKQLDLIVGFNISRFDYRVLGAYTPFRLEGLPTFDMLHEIHNGLGFRISLGHLGEKTLGRPKAGDGLQAVKWFRQGEWDNLIHYCREDVILTRDLFYHALEKGYLVYSDKSDRMLRIPTPWKIDDLIKARKI